MLPDSRARRRDPSTGDPTGRSRASHPGPAPLPETDLPRLTATIAVAADLAEGAAGVQEILHAIAGHEPVPVRDLSRLVDVPVPVVAAVCGELRRHGLVATSRPVRLTARGRAAVSTRRSPADPPGHGYATPCPTCHGHGSPPPPGADRLTDDLAALAAAAPPAELAWDQTHCTPRTKLRRALHLARHGLLGRRLLFLGDDDLTSLAVALLARQVGVPVPPMAVLDLDPRVLDHIGRHTPAGVTLVRHDLTAPLPEPLREGFDVVVTDPPYTMAGAELFLSRAVAALRPGGGGHVLLAFGARTPEQTLRLQELFLAMALVVRSVTPQFNEYEGAGVLGGTSHLYHLRTTPASRPHVTGAHSGPLYTAEHRPPRARDYLCLRCRQRVPVGPGHRYPQVAALTLAGCPGCGSRRFRPLSRRPEVAA